MDANPKFITSLDVKSVVVSREKYSVFLTLSIDKSVFLFLFII